MNYFTIAKDLVIAAAIAALAYMVYRGGEDRVKASDLAGLRQEMQEQTNIVHGWRVEADNASAKLATDVAAINAAPPVQHVWVRPQPICPQPAVLPGTPGQADNSHPAGGGVQPGRGADLTDARRDQILADFKRRWELVLAGCRAEDASWPGSGSR